MTPCISAKRSTSLDLERRRYSAAFIRLGVGGDSANFNRCWALTNVSSVSIALSQDFKKCLDQYLDVEPKAPIIDVPKIKLHALGDMLDRRRSATRAIALSPPGHARFDVVAKGVVTQNVLEIVVVSQRMWTRPDQ
jgi:hypothetical protein